MVRMAKIYDENGEFFFAMAKIEEKMATGNNWEDISQQLW